MTRNMRDYELSKTLAIPEGDTGGVTAESDAIDLGDAGGDFLAGCELRLVLPALLTAELPDDDTLTVTVQDASDEDFSEDVRDIFQVISVAGAGGAGAASVERRVRLPEDVNRYLRVKIDLSAESGDASAKSLTYELLF